MYKRQGQSIYAGEHIGQIITPDLKVQAQIDEHYVERVLPGLPADFTRDGGTYKPVSYTHLDVYKRQGTSDSSPEAATKPVSLEE